MNIKRYFAVTLLLLWSSLLAQDFPLRDPRLGENRPSWWLACWSHYIVVVSGTITFENEALPDVNLTISDRAANKYLDKQNQILQKKLSNFKIAKINVNDMLFSTPGISIHNLAVDKLIKNGKGELTILVRMLSLDNGKNVTMDAESGMKGVFILDYGSMIPAIPMIFRECIPDDKLDACKKIFDHRMK